MIREHSTALNHEGVVRQACRFVVAGLLIRIFASFLWGTGDVEWWKAWGTFSVLHGVTGIYGGSDREILNLHRRGLPWNEVWEHSQTTIAFQPRNYSQTEYKCVQPPLYVYTLALATRFYALFDRPMSNGRIFNLFINLPPVIASAALTMWMLGFLRGIANTSQIAVATAVSYWCNPNVLIISPIEGYWDPLVALAIIGAVFAIFNRSIYLAYLLAVCGVMLKPQAILLFPVIFTVGLTEHKFLTNLKAVACAAILAVSILSPFIVAGHVLSTFFGVGSIFAVGGDGLSFTALNLWWPVQYGINAASEISAHHDVWKALSGGSFDWNRPVSTSLVSQWVGVNVRMVAVALYCAFTLFNCLRTAKLVASNDRFSIFRAGALQVFAYFVLCVQVHENHYFLIIPLLGIVGFMSAKDAFAYWVATGLFSAQQLVFYGLGRDFNHGVSVLKRLHAGWTTNVLAAAIVALFVWLCMQHFRSMRHWPEPRFCQT